MFVFDDIKIFGFFGWNIRVNVVVDNFIYVICFIVLESIKMIFYFVDFDVCYIGLFLEDEIGNFCIYIE